LIGGRGTDGSYWCSSQFSYLNAWSFYLYNAECAMYNLPKNMGLPVRCIRDF
jgi:hypothetical protein